MDVLYVVRGDSLEFRYSLRSVERFASNVGRIVVAGTDLPPWLSDDVVRVEVDSPFERKQKNILYAILETMRRGVVAGPCLYSSDDHYLFAPYDFDAFPWFARRSTYRQIPYPPNPYRMSIYETGELLRANGLPCTNRLDGHWNTHLDARDLPYVEALVRGYERTRWGCDPSTPFVVAGIVRGACRELLCRLDIKVDNDSADFAKIAETNCGTLSSFPLAGLPNFRAWLDGMFPKLCRWEKR